MTFDHDVAFFENRGGKFCGDEVEVGADFIVGDLIFSHRTFRFDRVSVIINFKRIEVCEIEAFHFIDVFSFNTYLLSRRQRLVIVPVGGIGYEIWSRGVDVERICSGAVACDNSDL